MPIPLIVPALFAGASAAANVIGSNRQQAAREDALAAQRIRDRQFDRETSAMTEASRERYEDTGDQMAERSDNLASMFGEALAQRPQSEAAQMPTSDNVAVSQRNQASADEASARSAQRGEALGNFNSFGDMFGDLGRMQQRDAGRFDQISGFRRGSAGILPLELEAAQQKGAGFRTLGDLFGLGASLSTGPALRGSASFFGGG